MELDCSLPEKEMVGVSEFITSLVAGGEEAAGV